MDWLTTPFVADGLYSLEATIGEWFVVFAAAFFIFELVRYGARKELRWSLVADAGVNVVTIVLFIAVNAIFLGFLYVIAYGVAMELSLFSITTSWASILICIVLADLAYYWEHRFTHRVNAAWATHSVHHSSPFYNISVAYRFGVMDGVWPILFHVPLVFLGFHPAVVFFSEMLVLTYQTFLHTEAIKKLPAPIEFLFNTPSHHRVHHASNTEYLDTNYAGMFIIWDRLFGTFAKEKTTPIYGLVEPIEKLDTPLRVLKGPFVASFHGFSRVAKKVSAAKGLNQKFLALFGPPEWTPRDPRETV
ncbi:MAG: sterol desaturase family protein [Pseudomonadota bacterium]